MNKHAPGFFLTLLLIPLLSLATEGPWDRDPPYKPTGPRSAAWMSPDMNIISNVQGRVAVVFSIDRKGRPSNVVVLTSDDPRLEAPALSYMRNLRYPVPSNWGSAGEQWKRYDALVAFAHDKQAPGAPWLGSTAPYVVRTETVGY